jgi:hypothetical protein
MNTPTDNHWRNTVPDYNWMAALPVSAPEDVRFLIETLTVWLGTDDAAAQLADVCTVASDAAWYTGGPSPLADLACGWLSAGQSLDTLAEIHAASLALAAIATSVPAHIRDEDPVSPAVLTWLTAPDILDVLGEISAVCVRLASLTYASDREIAEWVTAWQSTDAARMTLARVSALTSALASVAEEMSAEASASVTGEGVEI